MKTRRYFVLFAFSFFAAHASAQQFLNGSMEPAATITTCSDIPKASYNSNMGNVWESGENATIYLANSSCGLGAAASGNYFTVLKYRVPLGNLLTFKLDANLVVGQAYKVAFKYKTIAGATSLGGARFGYSKDSASFDSTVGYRNGMVNTAWQNDTFSFTARKAWKFIWFEVITLQGFPYDLHLDDLKMVAVAPASVANIIHNDVIRVFPNPFHDEATISIDQSVQLPCKMQLFDMTGKQLMQNDINDRKSAISKAGLAQGMYLLKITGKDQSAYTSRLFAD